MTYSYSASSSSEKPKCTWCNGSGQRFDLVRVPCECIRRCSDFCNGSRQQNQLTTCSYCGGSGRGY